MQRVRKLWLEANAPSCIYCSSEDVKILDWSVNPAEWKCKSCRKHFSWEPDYAYD